MSTQIDLTQLTPCSGLGRAVFEFVWGTLPSVDGEYPHLQLGCGHPELEGESAVGRLQLSSATWERSQARRICSHRTARTVAALNTK